MRILNTYFRRLRDNDAGARHHLLAYLIGVAIMGYYFGAVLHTTLTALNALKE